MERAIKEKEEAIALNNLFFAGNCPGHPAGMLSLVGWGGPKIGGGTASG